MNSKTYTNVSAANVAAKIQAAGGPAMDLTQATGEASSHGVKLSWTVSKQLITNGPVDATVSIVSKPFFVPASTVWEHVDALFA